MTLQQRAQEKINDLTLAIRNFISDEIVSKITEHNVTANNSRKGHTQAGGVPQVVGTSLSAGTDNGYYARADHVHTASYNNLKDIPTEFPPTTHTHSYTDIDSISDVIVDVQLSNDGSQIIFLTDKD